VNHNAQPSQAFAFQYSFFLAFRTSRLDTCLRRAAVRSADDLLVTAYVRAAVYLRWPSATRCKGAAKSIRFPARHAQAFDDYHLSSSRVELASSTSLMLGDSSLRASLVGIDFLGSKQFRSAQCCISFVRESKSAGGPSLMSNFGRAAAVEISQICCGLAPTAPPFLRAICSIPSIGIAKFAAARSAWRYQQKYQQSGPLDFQSLATVSRGNSESN